MLRFSYWFASGYSISDIVMLSLVISAHSCDVTRGPAYILLM
jgi:hypothetical protein